ncbi:MAG TPA: hypothetical protein VGL19_12150 [Polyangiaceae bacterium]
MRIASTAALTALTLVVLAHGGVLACGSSDSGTGSEAGASTGGAAPVAGAGGAAVAGASTGGSSAGASAAGSAGASAGAPSAAGAGGSVSGAGGLGGGAGSGGAGGNASGGAAGSAGSGGMGGSGGAVAFALTSPTFEGHADCSTNKLSACGLFPKSMDLQAIGGMNMSPELDWTPGPAGTMSYAISLFDESNTYPHWVVWNIPAATMKLPASLPGGDSAGGITGLKQVSFNGDGSAYAGPGANSHVYLFKVYALKTATIAITLPGGGNKQQAARSALEASKDVIGSAMLRGATNP